MGPSSRISLQYRIWKFEFEFETDFDQFIQVHVLSWWMCGDEIHHLYCDTSDVVCL